MLKIRLQRVGRKHEPVFRLVVTESQNGPKSGKFLEILGSFDARRSEKAELKDAQIKHWLKNGAKASDTVFNLLVTRGIIQGKKKNVLPRKSPIKKEGGDEAIKSKDEKVDEKSGAVKESDLNTDTSTQIEAEKVDQIKEEGVKESETVVGMDQIDGSEKDSKDE